MFTIIMLAKVMITKTPLKRELIIIWLPDILT